MTNSVFELNKYLLSNSTDTSCSISLPLYQQTFTLESDLLGLLRILNEPKSKAEIVEIFGEDLFELFCDKFILIPSDESYLHNGLLRPPEEDVFNFLEYSKIQNIAENSICFVGLVSCVDILPENLPVNGSNHIRRALKGIFKSFFLNEDPREFFYDINLNFRHYKGDIKIYDLGNIIFHVGLDTYESFQNKVTKVIHKLNDIKATPFFLGGDHSNSFFTINALTHFYRKINVIHFDAHTDMYDRHEGAVLLNNANVFNQIERLKSVNEIYQIGVRKVKVWNKGYPGEFEKVKHVSSYDILVNHVQPAGFFSGIDKRIPIYLSFDVDVLDPLFAPEVSFSVPDGLSLHHVLQYISYIKSNFLIIGSDFVEVCNTSGKVNKAAQIVSQIIKMLIL